MPLSGAVPLHDNLTALDTLWLFPVGDGAWPFRFVLMLAGYGSVMVPGYFLVRFVGRRFKENPALFEKKLLFNFLKQFAVGQPEYKQAERLNRPARSAEQRSFLADCLTLAVYGLGIQITLVCMGLFQERIMTTQYQRYDVSIDGERFEDAQYLVFSNRVVALLLVICYLTVSWHRQPPHVPPFYNHSFISISNTLSSWCQYEALKFVSFPTQTVCKAAKIVPTMLMGRLLRGESYSIWDYVMASSLALGAGIFFMSTVSPADIALSDGLYLASALSGFCLMTGYLAFDAFTLNWQKKLFDTQPKVSPHQMMLGVNGFSALLCLVSLVQQGSLTSSTDFVLTHHQIARDIFLLSFSGACGQLFIYVTIQRFGPVVFAVIMTARQILSIVLSALYFEHAINVVGAIGLVLAFGSILCNIYRRYFWMSNKNANNPV